MLNRNQDQSIGAGAIAVQAARDVNIGLCFTEVRELCLLFLQQNFPKLREDALVEARTCVQQFIESLQKDIGSKATEINLLNFKNPDVQACLNDAVLAVARRGKAAHQEILCTLITERIAIQTSSFKEIVLAEAIQVTHKLTAEQIAMICLVHFVRSMSISNIQSLADLEPWAKKINPLVQNSSRLSITQKRHIQYTGACSYIAVVSSDPYNRLKLAYSQLSYDSPENFKIALMREAPTYAALIELYSINELWCIDLTSVGQAIALARLSSCIPIPDYSVWLN